LSNPLQFSPALLGASSEFSLGNLNATNPEGAPASDSPLMQRDSALAAQTRDPHSAAVGCL